MTNFAYMRVLSDAQDVKNQKFELLEYCNNQNITPIKFTEDTTSGKISWKERAIGSIFEKATAGDMILVSKISRLGRSTLQALEILEIACRL